MLYIARVQGRQKSKVATVNDGYANQWMRIAVWINEDFAHYQFTVIVKSFQYFAKTESEADVLLKLLFWGLSNVRLKVKSSHKVIIYCIRW